MTVLCPYIVCNYFHSAAREHYKQPRLQESDFALILVTRVEAKKDADMELNPKLAQDNFLLRSSCKLVPPCQTAQL